MIATRALALLGLVAACSAETSPSDGDAPVRGGIRTPDDVWTFVATPDARCADGSPTGYAVSPHANSDVLLILFRGGGLCWNYQDCVADPLPVYLEGYGQAEFDDEVADGILDRGILDRDDPANPYRDAHFAYVPYCTGDLHLGTRVAEYTSDTGKSASVHHVGSTNVGVFMDDLAPSLPGVTTVAVAGYSAGGFGATWNLPQIADHFAATMLLVADSAPFLHEPWFTAALQLTLDERYGAAASMPACPACSPSAGGQLTGIYAHLGATFPELRGALLSTTRDLLLSTRFSQSPGDSDLSCATGFACTFEAGLVELADSLATLRREPVKVFIAEGEQHVFLTKPLSAGSTNGVTLATWLGQQLENDAAWQSQRP